jgi:hypothetical protein
MFRIVSHRIIGVVVVGGGAGAKNSKFLDLGDRKQEAMNRRQS